MSHFSAICSGHLCSKIYIKYKKDWFWNVIFCLFTVPRVFLVDEERREISEKHYKPGSTIELHCIVTDYLPNFKEIFWKHGDQILSQTSERGGIR